MAEVNFYENVEDERLEFAVIIAKNRDGFVFCKHKHRETWEVSGGHREIGENIVDTAKRELQEETGALRFTIEPIGVYSVTTSNNFDEQETFEMLFYANIDCFELELYSGIEKNKIMNELPMKWTYPDIQPKLIEEAKEKSFLIR